MRITGLPRGLNFRKKNHIEKITVIVTIWEG